MKPDTSYFSSPRGQSIPPSPPPPSALFSEKSTCQAGVSVGSSDDEPARGVQMEDGVVIEVLGRHHRLDDELQEVSMDLLVRDILAMLGGDQNGVYTDGGHNSALLGVLHSHLGLAIGPHPGGSPVLAHLSQPVYQQGQAKSPSISDLGIQPTAVLKST